MEKKQKYNLNGFVECNVGPNVGVILGVVGVPNHVEDTCSD
jgi:hypothetical protein